MDNRQEISEFLRSRRAKISPEQAGFSRAGNRRVSGLRREEVAVIAGVSVEYYKRIERGALAGVSAEVLGAIAEALHLNEAEAAHLFDLARAAHGTRTTSQRSSVQRVRPGIRRMLDSIVGSPASVLNEQMDLLAANDLGRAFYSEILDSDIARGNNARFAFLDPRARDFYPHWGKSADQITAVLRRHVGRNPGDRGLSNLVGELAAQSSEFSKRWAAYNVKYHHTGRKRINHPTAGELELDYEAIELPFDPGLTILTYFAEPESPTAERLALLASWAATSDRESIERAAKAAAHEDG
ncbi:helix-turn-helix domain-containing protein [Streptomyces sp. NPDC002573]|uniref:helix-turn-helix domain-containing protein n=1 Tax=Streptomyces sp. NPDC002573 TaxID=3364651 RepID=UPI00369B65A5